MDWVYLLTGLHGRISRQPFWMGLAVLIGVEIARAWLADHIQMDKLSSIVGLALNYPEFALMLKRANDRNLPLLPIALFFVIDGLLGFLALLRSDAVPNPNDPIVVVMVYLWAALALVLIADLGFRRGTAGPNRFGPDPLGGKV